MSSRILDRIQEAAIEEFARVGYNAATTKGIADRAEVTEGSVYRLFKTKRELFEGCVQTAVKRSYSAEDFERNLVGRNLRERLQNALTALWARSHVVDFRLLMCAVVETPDLARKAIIREFERTETLIVAAIADDPSVRPEIDPDIAARMLLAGLRNLQLGDTVGEVSEKRTIDSVTRLLDVFLSGVLSDGSSSTPNVVQRRTKRVNSTSSKSRKIRSSR